jgi:hypothetical protein
MMSTESTRGSIQGHEPSPDSHCDRPDLRRPVHDSPDLQLAPSSSSGDLSGRKPADRDAGWWIAQVFGYTWITYLCWVCPVGMALRIGIFLLIGLIFFDPVERYRKWMTKE